LRLLAATLLLCLWICGGTAVADILPTGGNIVAGSGSIATNGNTMTVTQDTQRMAADWTSFSIGQNNTVNFNQPSSSAVALNRVTGADASVIQGALNANGQVFLVNPNGVLFSSTAQVNVGGIVASTLNITNDDFMAGNDRFAGNSSNAIVNQGNITTHDDGGTIALIAARIDNSGTLTANGGNVLMGAGSKVTLDLGGPVKIQVEEAAIDALIEQGGAIKADGGLVYLTARAAGELTSTVINHTGITEAQTLATGESGQIYLMGDMDNGRIEVAGILDASAPNGGDGGFVETSAARVSIADDVKITTKAIEGKTGEWLIDPSDYTVAATGGDTTGAALSTSLVDNNVTIQTNDGAGNGDIFVNDGITWQSGNTLVLNASRNIEINATIDASQGSGGKLALNYGLEAEAAGNTAYYLINAPVSLQASGAANGNNGETPTNFSVLRGYDGSVVNYTTITDNTGTALNTQLLSNLDGDFALSTNIGLIGTNNWTPIGNLSGKFTGRFEGLGHTIDGLNVTGTASDVGLFGRIEGAYIGNIALSDATIEGNTYAGALVGAIHNATPNSLIVNASSSGSVVGVDKTGSPASRIGGLVGLGNGKIIFSHSSAEVSLREGSVGNHSFGGLIGSSYGTIENSYATGKVSGKYDVGGLIGSLYNNKTIKNSYATGEVSGLSRVGGLLGVIAAGTIENSYATGKVTGTDKVGGFAGQNQGTVNTSYATGLVTGATDVGGFVGYNIAGVISNSFWDTDTAGTAITRGVGNGDADPAGVVGISNSDAYTQAAYAGFDFTNTWIIVTDYVGSPRSTRPFLRSEWSPVITNAHQLQLVSMDLSASYTLSNNIDLGAALGNQSEMWSGVSGDDGFKGNWAPIRTFSGGFDGHNHIVEGLYIRSPAGGINDLVGLFGRTSSSSTIANVGVTNVNIEGGRHAGALIGWNEGNINNAYSTGSVAAPGSTAGGLVSWNYLTGRISNVYSTASVVASISGGLVGASYGTITNAYATGDVSTSNAFGTGGLVGINGANGLITNTYATGTVTGTNWGGLVGHNYNTPTSVENSFWDTENTGQPTSAGGVGKTTAEMQKIATFNTNGGNWDVELDESLSKIYPFLAFTDDGTGGYTATWVIGTYATALNYTLSNVGADNGILYTGDNYLLSSYWTSSIFDGEGADLLLGTDYNFTYNDDTVTSFINAGTYSGITVTLLNPDYELAGTGNTAGTFKITPAPLTVTANNASKTYDGLVYSGGNGVSYTGFVNNETNTALSGTLAFSGNSQGAINAETYAITPGGLTSNNYNINFGNGTLTVNKAAATVTANSDTLTYNGLEQSVTGFTVSGLVNNEAASVLTVFTSGGSGTNADSYTHTASGTAQNYTLSFVDGNLTITQRPITVVADDKSKVYGNADPTLSWQVTDGNLVGTDTLNGALTRTVGENVDSYTIDASALANGNYLITANNGELTITQRPITVVADDKSKVYGNDDPSLTWQVTDGNLVGADTLSGALSRTAGENVGGYTIDASALANGNYLITANNGELTISQRPITVVADDKNKVYGNDDPSLSWKITNGNLVGGDTLSGVLTRTAGENVGGYTIDASALANGNYLITATDGQLTITQRPITVVADDKNKVYGNTDPTLTWKITNGNLVGSDTLSGVLTRTAGENVDSYTIDASALANGNYLVTASNGELTISQRPITVVADDKSKVYGNADPSLSWQVTDGNLVGDDTLSGALTRTAGKNVGSYTIDASALENGNYLITANNGELTISQRPITIAADDKSKIYGNDDPSLSWSVTAGNLVGDDNLTGVLTRTVGENVGTYSIDASALANGNYLITANNGQLTISQRPITIAADDKSKVYGNDDPSLSWSVTAGNLVGDDSLTGFLTRTVGENVGSYSIDASALANGNYLITANNGQLTISQRPITIAADDKSKVYRNADPALTWTVTEGNLVGSDDLNGALTRAAGENVGTYTIDASQMANGNYLITANDGTLTITAAPTNDQEQAAITTVQNLVTVVVGGLTGGAATPNGAPVALTTPQQDPPSGSGNAGGGISGGLNFVNVAGEPTGDGSSAEGTGSGLQPGLDASGLMNIFVVRGGVKYPEY